MELTIERIIRGLEAIKVFLDRSEFVGLEEQTKNQCEILDHAMDALQKYQKIEQILHNGFGKGVYAVFDEIVKVVEDGKIDADVLKEEVNSWGMNDYEPSDFTDAIDDAPTVEAIPKTDYENRLKADMVAMLTELYMEIEELDTPSDDSYDACVVDCEKLIQHKINELKETK